MIRVFYINQCEDSEHPTPIGAIYFQECKDAEEALRFIIKKEASITVKFCTEGTVRVFADTKHVSDMDLAVKKHFDHHMYTKERCQMVPLDK